MPPGVPPTLGLSILNGCLMTHYDFLIIGAGAAGCVVARTIAQRFSTASVGLLEAGPEGRVPPFAHSDLNSVFETWNPSSNWLLKTTPQTGLNNRQVDITQGKVLGGGTSVNAMMYVRGDYSVIEEWYRRSGYSDNWSVSEYQSAFKAIETYHHAESHPLRGRNGRISIRETPHPSSSADAFVDALVEAGYTRGDFNGTSQRNTGGLMQLNINPDGTRCSSARAYLSDPLPTNLSIELGTEVISLTIRKGRCQGVNTADGRTISADRIVLSAGAFLSPALLMASGIGDPSQLSQHGIRCEVANQNVGRNLSDHMRAMVAYESTVDPGVTEYLCEAALFISSGLLPSPEPDIQINFSAGVEGFIPTQFIGNPPPSHTVIFVPVLTRPVSRGSVKLLGSTIGQGIAIDPGYLTQYHDVETYIRSLEIIRNLASTESLKSYCHREICPGATNPADYFRDNAQTIWHPVGSCSMGASPTDSVVDPLFTVYGVDNLSIVDASVLPSLPSGNPQAAIFAMAHIASKTITDNVRAHS